MDLALPILARKLFVSNADFLALVAMAGRLRNSQTISMTPSVYQMANPLSRGLEP
jgi:hypothetical protein